MAGLSGFCVLRAGDDADALMSEFDEVLGGDQPAGPVVDAHAERVLRPFADGVDTDEGNVARTQ